MRIGTGKRGRPKHLAQIPGVGNKRIFDPLRQRKFRQGDHGAAFLLRDERHHARNRAQTQKRNFFRHQTRRTRVTPPPVHPSLLPSGHQSSSNITNGSVTSIGLLIKPSAKNNRLNAKKTLTFRTSELWTLQHIAHTPTATTARRTRSKRPCAPSPTPRIPRATDARQTAPPPTRSATSPPSERRSNRNTSTVLAA